MNEQIDEIPRWDLIELYNMFQVADEEGSRYITEDIRNKIKFGFNINFDLRYYIRDLQGQKTNITFDFKNPPGYVQSPLFQTCKYKDFEDELQKRQSVMRSILLKHYEEPTDKTESRT